MIRQLTEPSDGVESEEDSTKFLRHITYNHGEIVQAIIKEFPKEAEKEDFPWFR